MTATVVETTLPEKILLAAFQLDQAGQSPFSAEALIVTAWQNYPRTFGLKGYADQYPDANKVLASIMGEKGLARRGWLAKMGQKLYALTREGRQVIRRLRQEEPEPEAPPPAAISLPGDIDRLVMTLLRSTAFQKFQSGRKVDLNFPDACRFWNITEYLRNEELEARLNLVKTGLAEAERLVGNGTIRLSHGQELTSEGIVQLLDMHEYMEDRFSRHLALLRNRAERH